MEIKPAVNYFEKYFPHGIGLVQFELGDRHNSPILEKIDCLYEVGTMVFADRVPVKPFKMVNFPYKKSFNWADFWYSLSCFVLGLSFLIAMTLLAIHSFS